jgi:hypothetical protein
VHQPHTQNFDKIFVSVRFSIQILYIHCKIETLLKYPVKTAYNLYLKDKKIVKMLQYEGSLHVHYSASAFFKARMLYCSYWVFMGQIDAPNSLIHRILMFFFRAAIQI